MADVLEVYCDGGCRGNQYKENIGGWGAVLKYKEHIKEAKGNKRNTTNNEMEITACIEALELINMNFKGEVHLYTDSNYVYKCMTDEWYKKWQKNNWKTSSKKPVENKDLWVRLIGLVEKINPIFHKVEGHSGVELNEKADALANIAMDELEENNGIEKDTLTGKEELERLRNLNHELIEYIMEMVGNNDKLTINSILEKYGEELVEH